ncbi:Holin of 3TMs, for gene-transfer release [Novosphingobium sp. CF614]|uniref:holin family protein n=1 Tax=Novosphingobium sp. CF614 TaxID=1884364 RepID=UPI0008E722AB|nr:holin family protein [Novosphingobium sp. CF614]SFG31825.1 Holin of 3TMs, for gene-transfer release [Novosphingobium sp. CF614]
MPLLDSILGPIARLLARPLARIIDQVVPDPEARDRPKPVRAGRRGPREREMPQTGLSPLVAEASSPDPWTSRARPGFLYVMYAMILWALPMGLVSAFSPDTARAIASGMTAYLNGIPEPLYALFGTGYLGYSAMRQWGKVKGSDR